MGKTDNRAFESLEGVMERVEELRASGMSIVTTNGCFDLIHRGHVTYLNEAAELGGALIVGVNSDSSVRKLKGRGRPVQNQSDRVFILSNLNAVDSAFVFYEDDPREFLSVIKPDIHVKGGDYSIDIIERPVVEENGGRIEILSVVEGYSTSSILKRL